MSDSLVYPTFTIEIFARKILISQQSCISTRQLTSAVVMTSYLGSTQAVNVIFSGVIQQLMKTLLALDREYNNI